MKIKASLCDDENFSYNRNCQQLSQQAITMSKLSSKLPAFSGAYYQMCQVRATKKLNMLLCYGDAADHLLDQIMFALDEEAYSFDVNDPSNKSVARRIGFTYATGYRDVCYQILQEVCSANRMAFIVDVVREEQELMTTDVIEVVQFSPEFYNKVKEHDERKLVNRLRKLIM